MQPSDFITVMLVPADGEIVVDVEKLAEMGIIRVVSFLDLYLILFPITEILYRIVNSVTNLSLICDPNFR